VVDMSASNAWAEFSALFRNTRTAHLDHERAKVELKALMPEDAKEAVGHGVRGKLSKADRDRCTRRRHHPDDDPCPRLGGVDRLRLAGVLGRRSLLAPADGGGPDLCEAVRLVHPGRDRR
jgi:hypothetical protein